MSVQSKINENETLQAFVRVFQVIGLPILSGISIVGYNMLGNINNKLDASHDANLKQDQQIVQLLDKNLDQDKRLDGMDNTLTDIDRYIRDHVAPITSPTKK